MTLHRRALSLLPCLAVLGGCGEAPLPPEHFPSAELRLDGAWTRARQPDGSLRLSTNFTLEADRIGTGGSLELFDTWWRARAILNGFELGESTWGPASSSCALGGALREGRNELVLELWPPTDEPRLLTVPEREPSVREGLPPILHLRPESRISSIYLPLHDGEARPLLHLEGTPAGATVELVLTLDARPIERWTPIPARDGDLEFPSKRWRGPTWDPERSSHAGLIIATALLRDREGALLDARGQRVGLRDFSMEGGRFLLDQEPAPLLAARVDPSRSLFEELSGRLASGLNAAELHSKTPGPELLSQADELGLPLIWLPRCDAAIFGADSSGNPEEAVRRSEGALSIQDRALLDQASTHPSLLLWACEGSAKVPALLCARLAEDPLGRPVVGVDLDAILAPDRRPPDVEFPPAWIVETLGEGGEGALEAQARAFERRARGLGGVMPRLPEDLFQGGPADRPGQERGWNERWHEVGEQLGVKPWRPIQRRASSIVQVEGLEPGQSVWLESPWTSPVGAVAGIDGRARLELWHEGAARLRSGARVEELNLVAGSWLGLERKSAETRALLGAGL